jgi:hypothetical protein
LFGDMIYEIKSNHQSRISTWFNDNVKLIIYRGNSLWYSAYLW